MIPPVRHKKHHHYHQQFHRLAAVKLLFSRPVLLLMTFGFAFLVVRNLRTSGMGSAPPMARGDIADTVIIEPTLPLDVGISSPNNPPPSTLPLLQKRTLPPPHPKRGPHTDAQEKSLAPEETSWEMLVSQDTQQNSSIALGPAVFAMVLDEDLPPPEANRFTYRAELVGGSRRGGSASMILNTSALEHAALHELPITLLCSQTGTFLSRQKPIEWKVDDTAHDHHGTSLQMIVTSDAMQPRTSERWVLRRSAQPSQRRATPDSFVGLLFGVSSTFAPEADRLCVGIEENRRGSLVLRDAVNNHDRCAEFEFRSPPKHNIVDWTVAAATSRLFRAQEEASAVKIAIVTTVRPLGLLPSIRERTLQTLLLKSWADVVAALVVPTATTSRKGRDDAAVRRRGVRIDNARLVICVDSTEDADNVVDVLSSSSDPTYRGGVTVLSDCELHPSLKRPTYRGLFAKGEDALAAMSTSSSTNSVEEFVMMVNADVVIGVKGLRQMLAAGVRVRRQMRLSSSSSLSQPPPAVLITGSRWNCNPADAGTLRGVLSAAVSPTSSSAITPAAARSGGKPSSAVIITGAILNQQHCQLFQDDAEDYFLMSRGALPWRVPIHPADLTWRGDQFASVQQSFQQQHQQGSKVGVPPLVVGGVAFDNWLVATVATMTSAAAVVMDATAVSDAAHFSYAGVKDSHNTAASRFNSEVGHYCGGWAMGKLSSQQLTVLPYHGDDVTTGNDDEFDKATSAESFIVHRRGAVLPSHCTRAASKVGGGGPGQASPCTYVQPMRPRGDAFDGPWRG